MLEAMRRVSPSIIPGRTITLATGITKPLAVAIREALAVVGTREASAVATAAEAIDERRCWLTTN
jgi:hypothetical protein